MKSQVKLGPLIEATMLPVDTIPTMIKEAMRRDLTSYVMREVFGNNQFTDETLTLGAALDKDLNPIPNAPYWNEELMHNEQGWTVTEDRQWVWDKLVEILNYDLSGATFGTHPDDPACLGYWAEPNTDTRGEGVKYEWERANPGIILRVKKYKVGGEEYYLQTGDDMHKFQQEIGAVDFIWMNDPKNTEGRVFRTVEEHYDAIMDPYFGNE